MIRRICFNLVLSGLACFGAITPETAEVGSLRWNNGETITGSIDGASEESLHWRSPLFEEPLILSWSALRRIDRDCPAVSGGDAFRAILRNGDVVHGDVVSLDNLAIRLHSSRHGDIVLKRSEVLALQRIRGAGLVYSGPTGDAGWTTDGKQSEDDEGRKIVRAPLVVTGSGGSLLMPYWHGSTRMPIAMPTKGSIDLMLHSTGRPNFKFGFTGSDKGLRLETWDDRLVLVFGNAFKLIRKLSEEERELGLRLCWDRDAHTCVVFTLSGESLADWKVPGDFDAKGLQIESFGADLSVDLLRVRPWDGQSATKCDLSKPRIEMADGRRIQGTVAEGDGNSIKIAGSENETVSLNTVDGIIFSTDAPKVVERPAMLTFADGTRIGGKIRSATADEVALETAYSEGPLASKLGELRQWLIREPAKEGAVAEASLAKMDRIVGKDVTLHGKVTGMGDDVVRWLPVGGLKPAKPVGSFKNEIFRAPPAEGEMPVPAMAFAFTNGGDVLPGQVNSIDEKLVGFESNMIQGTSLPVEYLDAIQFNSNKRKEILGFNDSGWRVLKGAEKISRDGEKITLDAGASIGHPAGVLGSEIGFNFCSTDFSTFRLRFFCAGTDPQKALSFVCLRSSNQFICGTETGDGQFQDRRDIQISQSDVLPIRIAIDANAIGFYANGTLVGKFSIPMGRRFGNGLIVEPAGMFGNNISPVELSDFRSKCESVAPSVPQVNGETKAQALMVPRFRRDDPPRNVLIAANGDVLRGKLESATATHLGFRSGLETLRVPRDRVKAAVWLKKPQSDKTSSLVNGATETLLGQQITDSVRFSSTAFSLLNFLTNQEPELKFEFHGRDPKRRLMMAFGGMTIGDALAQICEKADLAYRIEKDGRIVVDSEVGSTRLLVQRSYWLTNAAIPAEGSVQKFLAGVGVAFPEGSSATWLPTVKQLTVVNTEENHRKLAETINTKLGGALKAPSHWLALNNGGRIALAVDRFDVDSISGSHPVYGACKIAMKDVASIRTSPPEATPSMRALSDWVLVNAPEPAIEDEKSASLIGKDAAPFKLKTVAGEEFELTKQKGKVVVLDFWATWCGPCVKSLPGLIQAMTPFPEDKVKFIGVNQGEAAQHVKEFLEARRWKLDVALDASQSVAKQFGVEGIPHTVVIGPDGKIALAKTGYNPEGEKEIAQKVTELLGAQGPTKATSAPEEL